MSYNMFVGNTHIRNSSYIFSPESTQTDKQNYGCVNRHIDRQTDMLYCQELFLNINLLSQRIGHLNNKIASGKIDLKNLNLKKILDRLT